MVEILYSFPSPLWVCRKSRKTREQKRESERERQAAEWGLSNMKMVTHKTLLNDSFRLSILSLSAHESDAMSMQMDLLGSTLSSTRNARLLTRSFQFSAKISIFPISSLRSLSLSLSFTLFALRGENVWRKTNELKITFFMFSGHTRVRADRNKKTTGPCVWVCVSNPNHIDIKDLQNTTR